MKIYLDTIGCRLNQSEIETFARQFRAAGHEIVSNPEQADLAVVNTCAVTIQAAADSRKTIRHIARAGVDEIAVTGCWATLEPHEALALPGVQRVVTNDHKEGLVSQVLHLPQESFDLEPLARQPLPGARLRTRAFIKVQDGCDNRCTFCITTVARGAGRSRPLSEVLADIRAALDGGAQEVVLTGVHLGSWGKDFTPRRHLRHLVEAILTRTAAPRVRLSSLEPWNLNAGFFELWQEPRLCRHLHLPLQSGSNATLRRMARKTTQASFSALIEAARAVAPDIAITTDIIVGFPGETETEFEESLAFVQQMAFAGGHVFTYSPRKGTAAAHMPAQVPHPVRKARNARMQQVIAACEEHYRAQFVGQTRQVLWESAVALGPEGWQVSGLTDNYLRVQAGAPQILWNQLSTVRLTALRSDGLEGVLVSGG
ncbi:MAG: tRNA (N(6)-L-threonylcarbamoyladenosine(37)-C(2))-methylthiotransferase MtaB [Anaerolineales bacterium]